MDCQIEQYALSYLKKYSLRPEIQGIQGFKICPQI
jgi:hypothetical protein